MRIGEWVPIFKQWLPIPQRMAMAFGLQEGSELYLAPVTDDPLRPDVHNYEMFVSPVPALSWRSVCRLSVRLEDTPKALATATRFLRDCRINILLTECCTTYKRRAHWDAVCDLGNMERFVATLQHVGRDDYQTEMQKFLDTLSEDFKTFAHEPENSDAFLKNSDEHISFSPLTGLNDAHFICDTSNVSTLTHRAGAIRLPDKVSDDLIARLAARPDYAIVTGNTEQRYIRVLFMRDYEHIFQVKIENDLKHFAGGGVGVLHQILQELPPEINLVRAANYIVTKNEKSERGRIELIGYWPLPETVTDKSTYMKRELRNKVEKVVLEDIAGDRHEEALTIVDDFVTPPAVYPRVFVSYSSRGAENQLQHLLSKLLASSFEPVLGSDPRPDKLTPFNDGSEIAGCVAFVSLQLRREDYKVTVATTGETRYVLPPWATVEEAFAHAKGVRFIIRLKDKALEEYDTDVPTIPFSTIDKYEQAVDMAIAELRKFRESKAFPELLADARARQFDPNGSRS